MPHSTRERKQIQQRRRGMLPPLAAVAASAASGRPRPWAGGGRHPSATLGRRPRPASALADAKRAREINQYSFYLQRPPDFAQSAWWESRR